MKRLAAGLVFLGSVLSLPLTATAVVLTVSVRDPATLALPESLSASEREEAIAKLPEVGDIVGVKKEDWKLDDSRLGKRVCKNNPPANGGTLVCVEIPGPFRREALLPLTSHVFFINSNGETDVKKFRRYRIAWEKLPESIKSEAHYTGMVVLPDWQNYILDKEAN